MGSVNSHVDSKAPLSNSTVTYVEGNDNYWTCDGNTEKDILLAESGVASKDGTPPQTVLELFQDACKKWGDKIALRVERKIKSLAEHKESGDEGNWPKALPEDAWTTWTYTQYYEECCKVARSLIALGLEQHDAVTIFGFNSPEWVMSEVGAIMAGGKAAGIYPTDTAEQVTFKARHSGAVVALVESKKKMEAFKANIDTLSKLKAIIVWGESVEEKEIKRGDGSTVEVLSWSDFIAKSSSVDSDALEARGKLVRPGHCCALIYTSGTTGNPKAVMISHDNIIFESTAITQKGMLGSLGEGGEERILSYLPLSHVAGMMVDIISPLVLTARTEGWVTLSFARIYDLKVGSLGDRLRDVKPTLFLGVPRVWEKIMEKMMALGAQSKGCKKCIVKWAKGKGLERATALQLGGDGHMPGSYGLANRIVLSKVAKKLGLEHCKVGLTGAAPIRKETLEFYGALGIQINEVYGMSECCGATTWSTQSHHVWGSCGFGLDGTEVKVFKVNPEDINSKTECPPTDDIFNATEEQQGEICFRGRHIMMGYMANPDLGEEHVEIIKQKNRDAIDKDGWLHSGDKGCVGTNGMFKITGRYKELIIGAGGENIAPVPIEGSIKLHCPAISNVMMFGDKMKYNVCIVTLKAEGATGEEPGNNNLAFQAAKVSNSKTITEASSDPAFINMISSVIFKTVNGQAVNNASKIQKFTILPADFSVNTNELTPTFKLKRSVVFKKYEEQIMQMYQSKDRYVPFNSKIAEAWESNKNSKEDDTSATGKPTNDQISPKQEEENTKSSDESYTASHKADYDAKAEDVWKLLSDFSAPYVTESNSNGAHIEDVKENGNVGATRKVVMGEASWGERVTKFDNEKMTCSYTVTSSLPGPFAVFDIENFECTFTVVSTGENTCNVEIGSTYKLVNGTDVEKVPPISPMYKSWADAAVEIVKQGN